MRNDLAIEYTFKIIIGIIVVLVVVGLILTFRQDIYNTFSSLFKPKNQNNIVVQSNVNLKELIYYIIACYQKKTPGVCYVVEYNDNPISCQDLISDVQSINPNVIIKPCNYQISQGNLVEISYLDNGIIDIYVQ